MAVIKKNDVLTPSIVQYKVPWLRISPSVNKLCFLMTAASSSRENSLPVKKSRSKDFLWPICNAKPVLPAR